MDWEKLANFGLAIQISVLLRQSSSSEQKLDLGNWVQVKALPRHSYAPSGSD